MMMNALSQVSKDTDIGKQMAYMRNYINQLRDEIENDLMNIGYNNLDADLRKRIDDMQTGYSRTEAMTTEVAGLLKTQYLTAQEIITNYITAREASLTYATIGSLNAVSAEVGELSTKKLDATTAYVDFMEVRNWVSAGYIRADKIKTGSLSVSQLIPADGTVATPYWQEFQLMTDMTYDSVRGWIKHYVKTKFLIGSTSATPTGTETI